ncbi:MAG: LacI family DNA-binding transcriptional regulator [Rikenellaceae bacterium]
MQKRPVSLKDIASVLNISVSAVSRALRDQYDVSPTLKAKVKEVAKEMGYRPNPHARGLINQSTNLVGIIVPDLVTYFYSSIIEGIETVLRKNGYYPIIASSHESYEQEIEAINNMLNIRVAGIIICLSQESDDYTHLKELENTAVATVYVDRVPNCDMFHRVVSNNREATKLLTNSLIEKGCKRIALISGPSFLNICEDRKRGYLEALKENFIEFDENLYLECRFGSYDGNKTLDSVYEMEPRPDGIICINDTIFYGMILASRERNIPFITDFKIGCFTDKLHRGLISSKLSVLTHPSYEMGYKSAEKLIELIKNGSQYTRKEEVCCCTFTPTH